MECSEQDLGTLTQTDVWMAGDREEQMETGWLFIGAIQREF